MRSRIAIGVCVASGSPITTAPSRRCGATSPAQGATIEAVDLEALCQRIERPSPRDLVEFVHLSWPIRNRDGLLAALRADKSFARRPRSTSSIPTIRSRPRSMRFFLLDRPRIEAENRAVTRRRFPWSRARSWSADDTVILETYDDGRLDRLVDRFTAAAGSNIPPAHPRTKIIGKEPRHLLASELAMAHPRGVAEEEAERLNHEQIAHIVRDVWPETPNPSLRWRTPLQAAQAGDAETALRAAVRQLQTDR